MELVAVVFTLLICGSYGQWTTTGLTTTCESYIKPFPCPGLPCEQCGECISDYLYECKCLPASFLAEYPNADAVNVCWYSLLFWVEPKCCEVYKDQMKRNGVHALGESAGPFIGLLPDLADTDERDNHKTGNATTNVSDNGVLTSSVDLDYSGNSERNGTEDLVEEDLKNIDITDTNSDKEKKESTNTGESEKGEKVIDSGTQDENRTGKTAEKDKNKDGDRLEDRDFSEYDRRRRESVLMRALMLTQDLLSAEDLLSDVQQRGRIK